MKNDAIKHTVLVVEDEEDLREMMREALELNGYAVVTAEDGRQALAQLSGIAQLCLVLIDLLMPGMNGWDLFQELRRRSELDHVPGIGPRRRRTLLTTFGSVAGVRRATREELEAVVGRKVADAVLAFFAGRP